MTIAILKNGERIKHDTSQVVGEKTAETILFFREPIGLVRSAPSTDVDRFVGDSDEREIA